MNKERSCVLKNEVGPYLEVCCFYEFTLYSAFCVDFRNKNEIDSMKFLVIHKSAVSIFSGQGKIEFFKKTAFIALILIIMAKLSTLFNGKGMEGKLRNIKKFSQFL